MREGEKEFVSGVRKHLRGLLEWARGELNDEISLMRGELEPKDMNREYLLPRNTHELVIGELVRFALIQALTIKEDNSKEAYDLIARKLAEARSMHDEKMAEEEEDHT
ncbi:MAG: hypothetical protein CMO36_02655 [Verrucomicrobiaceae bacterium]|nr:hypothetical protein [Verrucomicrobiaceae bacterium]